MPSIESEDQWLERIRACHLTLGLPRSHSLSGRIHEVYLPALAPRATRLPPSHDMAPRGSQLVDA